MYKQDFINTHKLHFATSSIAQDAPFTLSSTLNAQRIGYSATPHYNYRIHGDSAARIVSDKKMSIFQCFDSLMRVMEECGLKEELLPEFDTFVINRCNVFLNRVASKDTFEKVRRQRISPQVNKIVDNLRETGPTIMSILDALKLRK